MIKSYITNTDGNVQLTRHFKVKEFACKDGSPVVFIDDYLYTILDILRNKLGKPVIITSGYRTPSWNTKCGGAKYSYHMRGMAADIRVDGMNAKELAKEEFKRLDIQNPTAIVVDEAHYFGSPLFLRKRSQLSEKLYKLLKQYPNCDVLLLTATPIRQNQTP